VLLSTNKPDHSRSRVVPRCLNPVWDEVLTFEAGSLDSVLASGVHVSVMDHDVVGSDDHLGEAYAPLDALRSASIDYVVIGRPRGESKTIEGPAMPAGCMWPTHSCRCNELCR